MNKIGAILRALNAHSGVDFRSYRTPTIERRVHNRMMSLGVKDLAAYHLLLEQSAQEARELVERITIKVSRFYRNPEVFDALRSTVLPELRQAARPLRLWSAGCGRGEEPYSLAMLLEDAGAEGSVTASDLDAVALAEAAQARYPESAAADLPAEWRDRFLQARQGAGRSLEVRPAVRSRVVWRQEDLIRPAEPHDAAYDLICCRNVLIYWSAAAQRAILGGLLARLRSGGFLCLGEAEWPDASHAAGLEPLGPRLRLFRKVGEAAR